tara:strand:- start:395 stop:1321 length:927 start_codon:yes stop_codon:yes gene_type:complete
MIALGGNSLSKNNGTGSIGEQFSKTREALEYLSEFIEKEYNICINHGNGPQVGNELLRMDLTYKNIPPLPLGLCVANTQGSIGYMIQQSLQNKLRKMQIDREVVTLVSQVIVDKNDTSFKNPTKFVGSRYSKKDILELSEKFNWEIKEQELNKWRRVVPSPMPKYIMHGKSIKSLVDRGSIVIASGGGGIPVYSNKNGDIEGVDAVIDKDYSAAKLGHIINANQLWIITDVECVYLNYKKKNQTRIKSMDLEQATRLYKDGIFQEGSMGPKIKAAMHFLKHKGDKVVITSISKIKKALYGKAGTEIRN